MKCVIIFVGLLAIAFAKPLNVPSADSYEEIPCEYVPEESVTESESTTLVPIEERVGEEASAGTTLSDEAPTTYAPLIDTVAPTVVVEELPATTVAPAVEERISETVAPTVITEELIATTLAPVSETVAPTVVVEELTAAPETIAPPLVDPTPGLRFPDVSDEPSVALETPAPTVVEPLKEEEPAKPEESAIIEEPKPEKPKKLSRLITFTFYDHNSKATSLKHFLEYLRSLKK